MDLFDSSTDLTPVDQPSYLRLVGMAIWLLKLRFEIQLAVIMACTHNAEPTQGDLIKAIRFLAYLKGTPDLGPIKSSSYQQNPAWNSSILEYSSRHHAENIEA